MENKKPKLKRSTLTLLIILIVVLFLAAGGFLYLYLSGSISASTPSGFERGSSWWGSFKTPTPKKTATATKTKTATVQKASTTTEIKINILLDGRPYYHDGRLIELWDSNSKLTSERTGYGEITYRLAPYVFPVGKVKLTLKAAKDRNYKDWAPLKKEIEITAGRENSIKLNYISQNNIWVVQ